MKICLVCNINRFEYTSLSDDMVGHLWASKLLITWRVIKVIHLHFALAICSRLLSIYNYVLYIFR